MLDIQLGRRNLSPIQRIAVAEKYRPFFEKQAKENQGVRNDLKNNFGTKLTQSEKEKMNNENRTNKKLADIAGVKPTTYKMGAKVLNSGNEDLKQRVLSGEKEMVRFLLQMENIAKENRVSPNGEKRTFHNCCCNL